MYREYLINNLNKLYKRYNKAENSLCKSLIMKKIKAFLRDLNDYEENCNCNNNFTTDV